MVSERTITFRGTPAQIEEWLQALDGPIAANWSRDSEIERRVQGNRSGRGPICLVWSGGEGHPRSAIFLQPTSADEMKIMSVVALDRAKLEPEDRDAAIEAFRTQFVVPRGEGLHWADTTEPVGLSEWISPRAHARFLAFARTANKEMLHSGLDLPRWYDFLIQLHRDGASPAREEIEAALEDEHFGANAIKTLLDAYDHTNGVLTRYDDFEESE